MLRTQKQIGFTLIELIVVVAIIGILVAITLPAVQQARESSRRTACANNLRQLGIGLLNFESANQKFPAGAEIRTAHSWASRILPHLEQDATYQQIDFNQFWKSTANQEFVLVDLEPFACPSSWKTYEGFTDYSGISGSWIGSLNGSRNGMLFPVSESQKAVRAASVTDGLSNTVLVGEGVAVTEINNGYWASGLNCFSHDDGPVNNRQGGLKEIASLHPSGAQVVLADGSVHFIAESIEKITIGALCTRNQGEVISVFP